MNQKLLKSVANETNECRCCKKKLSHNDFYMKSVNRRDTTCISCRKEKRNLKYQNQKSVIVTSKREGSKRIIEPKLKPKNIKQATDNEFKNHTRDVSKMDFSDIDQLYGKKTNNIEQYEIINRFNEFVALLREGYSEIAGSEVYVRKD